MNDMPLVLNYVNLDLYADDTTLYVAGPSLKIIEKHLSQDLESFETWCETNYLVVNTKKSKCLVLCTKKQRSLLNDPQLNLSIKNNNNVHFRPTR